MVGGALSSHMVNHISVFMPVGFSFATMYAYVGTVHAGVCAFAWGNKIAAENVSSRIKAALCSVLVLSFFIFHLFSPNNVFLESVSLVCKQLVYNFNLCFLNRSKNEAESAIQKTFDAAVFNTC